MVRLWAIYIFVLHVKVRDFFPAIGISRLYFVFIHRIFSQDIFLQITLSGESWK